MCLALSPNKGILQLRILTLSSCHPFDANPPQSEHSAMVVDMQEGHLVELFPHDEKHCVQVFNALRDEVPPQSSCHLFHNIDK